MLPLAYKITVCYLPSTNDMSSLSQHVHNTHFLQNSIRSPAMDDG